MELYLLTLCYKVCLKVNSIILSTLSSTLTQSSLSSFSNLQLPSLLCFIKPSLLSLLFSPSIISFSSGIKVRICSPLRIRKRSSKHGHWLRDDKGANNRGGGGAVRCSASSVNTWPGI